MLDIKAKPSLQTEVNSPLALRDQAVNALHRRQASTRKTRRSQEIARLKVSVDANNVSVADRSNVIVDSTRRAPAVIDELESEQEILNSKAPPTKQSKRTFTDEHQEVSSGAEGDDNDERTEEQEETDLRAMKANKLKETLLAEVCNICLSVQSFGTIKGCLSQSAQFSVMTSAQSKKASSTSPAMATVSALQESGD